MPRKQNLAFVHARRRLEYDEGGNSFGGFCQCGCLHSAIFKPQLYNNIHDQVQVVNLIKMLLAP